MKEHHVEKAFRQHARRFKCEGFAVKRVDHPQKRFIDDPDFKLSGRYVWCDRKFEFVASLHRPPWVGRVFVRAFAKCQPRVDSLLAACDLMEKLLGYGVDLQCLVDVDSSKAVFLGINTLVTDFRFHYMNVNAISASLHFTLRDIEAKVEGQSKTIPFPGASEGRLLRPDSEAGGTTDGGPSGATS